MTQHETEIIQFQTKLYFFSFKVSFHFMLITPLYIMAGIYTALIAICPN